MSISNETGCGRPHGVVRYYVNMKKISCEDGTEYFAFSCKYCGGAKQKCKPGAPPKIPKANRVAEHLLFACNKCPDKDKWKISHHHLDILHS